MNPEACSLAQKSVSLQSYMRKNYFVPSNYVLPNTTDNTPARLTSTTTSKPQLSATATSPSTGELHLQRTFQV